MSAHNGRMVPYKCHACGADDKLHVYLNEPIPVALNCYKCGAGRGLDPSRMIQEDRGMFPVVAK